MAAYTKFNKFTEDLLSGIHTLTAAGNVVKVMLTNSAVVATNTVKADLTDLATANGYTAGGTDIQNVLSRTGGVTSMTATDVTWTASGGSIGPFRYAVIYNDTAASDQLIGYWDYGSAVTVLDTQTFTVDFGASVFDLT